MIKKVLITSALFLATYAVADQQKEDGSGCSGPLLTIVAVSQDKSNFDQKSNQILEKFFRSNIKEKENSITMSDLLTAQRESKNELFVSLNRKGIKALQAAMMKANVKAKLGALGATAEVKCECAEGETPVGGCWFRSDSKGNSLECGGDPCCEMIIEIKGGKIDAV